jgi:hypothetical protein
LTDAILLIAVTSAVHSSGTLILLWSMIRYRPRAERHFGFMYDSTIITVLALTLVALHLVEAGVWAVFYLARGCFTDLQTAVYFFTDFLRHSGLW